MKHAILPLILCSIATAATAQPITTAAGLLDAVSRGAEGTVIDIGEGTFRLSQPLDLKTGMTLKGAGIGKTIVTHVPEWKAAGLEQPLAFRCGVDGEVMVDGWKTGPASGRQGNEPK